MLALSLQIFNWKNAACITSEGKPSTEHCRVQLKPNDAKIRWAESGPSYVNSILAAIPRVSCWIMIFLELLVRPFDQYESAEEYASNAFQKLRLSVSLSKIVRTPLLLLDNRPSIYCQRVSVIFLEKSAIAIGHNLEEFLQGIVSQDH